MKSLVRRAFSPLREFIADSRAVGIVLLLGTVASMVVANSAWGSSYVAFWSREIPLLTGGLHLPHTPLHGINDALMSLFFLLAGLEIKRELRVGELSDLRQALLPVVAAVGGMVAPALLYGIVGHGTPAARGWGIPMATDIAFSLAVLSLLGRRVPVSARIFLTALAIIDDLGGILTIAVFYAQGLQAAYLAAAGGVVFLLLLLNRLRVTASWPYLLLGLPLWYCVYRSGVHPTVAGVLLAFCMPLKNINMLEHRLHDPVSFGILPLFAAANTAFVLPRDWSGVLSAPAYQGILLGLLLGKPLGIVGAGLLARRLRWAKLPRGLTVRHLIGIGLVAGIGFTMSLFIAVLAFPDAARQDEAKLGIVTASVLAGLAGFFWLRRSNRVKGAVTA